jgi:hypothetical protein
MGGKQEAEWMGMTLGWEMTQIALGGCMGFQEPQLCDEQCCFGRARGSTGMAGREEGKPWERISSFQNEPSMMVPPLTCALTSCSS